jgi:hypothetical protein
VVDPNRLKIDGLVALFLYLRQLCYLKDGRIFEALSIERNDMGLDVSDPDPRGSLEIKAYNQSAKDFS